MSEYQYIEFRAVDRPLTDQELKFANTQSTRAEITRWSFANEYQYSNFRGDENELLRRGYDVHLHCANFGIRKVAIRLPNGFPFPKNVWSEFVAIEGWEYQQDQQGRGGILTINPFHDAGSANEIWNASEYMDDFVAVRNRLVEGDLRVLYLLWLCAMGDDFADDQVIEPPVPAGLDRIVDCCSDAMAFFGIDPLTLVAAAEGTPGGPDDLDRSAIVDDWLKRLSKPELQHTLNRFLTEPAAGVQAEVLAEIRNGSKQSTWPTIKLNRTFRSLLDRAEKLREEADVIEEKKRKAKAAREAAKQERQRQDRMTQMVKDPKKWLREADELVDARGTSNYKLAAEILADLREAVGGKEGAKITRKHAAHLSKKHPTLTHLKSSLRKRGLLE